MSHRELLDRVRAELFDIQEAKEGGLFRHLRRAISDEYGIPHDQIETAISVDKLIKGVYADHQDVIDAAHRTGGERFADKGSSFDAFESFVRKTHSRATNTADRGGY